MDNNGIKLYKHPLKVPPINANKTKQKPTPQTVARKPSGSARKKKIQASEIITIRTEIKESREQVITNFPF